MIDKELARIELETEKARNFVYSGDLNKAQKTIDKLKNSFCITESDRAIILIEALILATKQKKTKAKLLICKNNYYAWGCDRLQQLLREFNQPCDNNTKLFSIRIKSDNVESGVFSCFGPGYYCDLGILANDLKEALLYIKEFCRFNKIEDIEILHVFETEKIEGEEFRGIGETSPFFRLEESSRETDEESNNLEILQ